MKRSSSKLIAKAGSVRNVGKMGYKFNVTLHLESVDKLLTSSDVVVSWERNAKITASKPVRVDKDSRTANFNFQTLSQDITFFKKKKDVDKFDEKIFRIYLRHAEGTKKIGKIDLNFSDHIGIPSHKKRIGAPLSNGSRLVLSIESKYLGEATKKPKNGGGRNSDGASSVGTSSNLDNESEFDPTDSNLGDIPDLDDLNDLIIEDEQQPAAPPLQPPSSSDVNTNTTSALVSNQPSFHTTSSNTTSTKTTTASTTNYTNSQNNYNDEHSNLESNSTPSISHQYSNHANLNNSASSTTTLTVTKTASNQQQSSYNSTNGTINNSSAFTTKQQQSTTRRPPLVPSASLDDSSSTAGAPYHRRPSAPSTSTNNNNNNNTTSSSSSGGGLASRFKKSTASKSDNADVELEKLRKENRLLKRRNDDLQTRANELERKLDNYYATGSVNVNGDNGLNATRTPSDRTAELKDLLQENRSLKEHIDELEMRIKREPIYADVVRDLREAKMALAIMNIERDELKQEIRRLKK